MTKEKQTMTIHRALAELKLLDAKIEKQTREFEPCGVHIKGKTVNFLTEEEFKTNATSTYDSILDLIKRKQAIKTAIVNANAVTKVKVGKEEMTIAEAINYKVIISHKADLVAGLNARYNEQRSIANQRNTLMEVNLQKLLEMMLGKDNIKAGNEDVEAVAKPYKERNETLLFDPLNALNKVKELQEEIDTFNTEVDADLSEVNAITTIEI